MELSSFLSELRAAGVKRFEIELDTQPLASGQVVRQHAVNVPTEGSNPSSPANEQPQDLPGTNDAMSYDQILNWSADPGLADSDTTKEQVPLTGDAPLGDA